MKRQLPDALGLLLFIILLPLIVIAIALYLFSGVLLHITIWCCWCVRGRYALFVYSDSRFGMTTSRSTFYRVSVSVPSSSTGQTAAGGDAHWQFSRSAILAAPVSSIRWRGIPPTETCSAVSVLCAVP